MIRGMSNRSHWVFALVAIDAWLMHGSPIAVAQDEEPKGPIAIIVDRLIGQAPVLVQEQPLEAGEGPIGNVDIVFGRVGGVIGIENEDGDNEVVIMPPMMQQDPKAMTRILEEQVRGLIQNELNVVDRLCAPNDDQKRKLVNLAESQWHQKSKAAIRKGLQDNPLQQNDFDGLVERMTKSWCEESLDKSQLQKFEEELESRRLLRKDATIDAIVSKIDNRLYMSFDQCTQVRLIIQEKWKDRWYRSLEGLTHYNIGNEIRSAWIEAVLTPIQRKEFATIRENEYYWFDERSMIGFPTLPGTTRFHVGSISSDESVPLQGEFLKKLEQNDEGSDDDSVRP